MARLWSACVAGTSCSNRDRTSRSATRPTTPMRCSSTWRKASASGWQLPRPRSRCPPDLHLALKLCQAPLEEPPLGIGLGELEGPGVCLARLLYALQPAQELAAGRVQIL